MNCKTLSLLFCICTLVSSVWCAAIIPYETVNSVLLVDSEPNSLNSINAEEIIEGSGASELVANGIIGQLVINDAVTGMTVSYENEIGSGGEEEDADIAYSIRRLNRRDIPSSSLQYLVEQEEGSGEEWANNLLPSDVIFNEIAPLSADQLSENTGVNAALIESREEGGSGMEDENFLPVQELLELAKKQ
uniref:Uncharacterized protein LOC102801340 n=1 Tax=Saccoglossus kowalevskii TaxID=10224 RepID=A0ABM0LVL6_SACKO|nr:PREDICTED: uncharacterized protein LOC102801340 [Saccoglossus kowalevskii]